MTPNRCGVLGRCAVPATLLFALGCGALGVSGLCSVPDWSLTSTLHLDGAEAKDGYDGEFAVREDAPSPLPVAPGASRPAGGLAQEVNG